MPFVIDVDPVAFTLVGIPVRWYGLIFVGAAALGIWLAQREGRRHGVGDEILSDAVIWVAVAALVGGRALYIIQNELGSIASDPFHVVMIWQGGLSFYGGLLAAIGALVIFARRRQLPFLLAADVAAPAAALGQAIGHLGCLIGGDSYGTVTSLPWAVIYRNPAAMAPLEVPLHPTQVYEALAFGLLFLRDEAPVLLGLKTAQLIGLGIGALGLAILAALAARRITDRRSILEVGRP